VTKNKVLYPLKHTKNIRTDIRAIRWEGMVCIEYNNWPLDANALSDSLEAGSSLNPAPLCEYELYNEGFAP
jgi:hypothetical protein